MLNRLKTYWTIDSSPENAMNVEKELWSTVFERVLSTVLYLAQRNLLSKQKKKKKTL